MARSILLVAAAIAASAAHAQIATPARVYPKEFVPVPPVWVTAQETRLPRITAGAVCALLDDAKTRGVNPPAGLDGIPCGSLAGHLDAAALAQKIPGAIRALEKLNARCEAKPADEPCAALFLASRARMAGREKVGALVDDFEDRDLDGAQRPTTEDKQAGTGLSPEARFIEGLTNFVLDRAKVEAIAYFEERFHTTLCAGDAEDPKVSYFAAVCHVLSNARNAGFSLAAASREMRAAARRDLRALPDGALQQQYVNTGASVYPLLRVWLALAVRLRDNTLPADRVFAAMANVNPDVCKRDEPWTRAEDANPQFVEMALKALDEKKKRPPQAAGITDPARYTADQYKAVKGAFNSLAISECLNTLQALAYVGSALDFASGLADGRSEDQLVDATVLAGQVKRITGEKPPAIADAFVTRFLTAVAALQGLGADIEHFNDAAANAYNTAEDARKLQGLKRNEILREFSTQLAILIDRTMDMVDSSVLAFVGCGGECVLTAPVMRERITAATRLIRQNARLAREVLEDRWVVVAVEVSKIYFNREGGTVRAFAGQYAPVIAELAGAKTTVEVQKILNDAAAPAGTYREKFRGNMRSISAVVGLSWGREWYRTDEARGTAEVIGLFAPIGLHLTFWRGNLGLFGSLLDLGPYASYRSDENNVSKNQDVGLKQLFSPGLYLTHSISVDDRKSWLYDWFNKSPFVVGAGISRTPALLQTSSGRDVASNRAQIFIAIDVPMFPF